MRFIKTNNSIAEFIETDKTGKIISSRGFQFGVIYFEIKNKKVAFYLDNDEQPFQNFVWSTDIPLTIDDVEYETEEEVSAALHSIFNDRFQEQLDQLKEDLAAEEARAQDAENALDDKIDLEIQNRINAVSGLTERVADDEAAFGAALVDLNNKINAVSGENASQNVQISGLNNSINTEISRATSVENALRSDLTNETSARTNADAAMLERIVAVEVGKADANSVYTKAESDNKYATKDYISGLTDEFQEKLVAGENITISGNVISATGGGGGITPEEVQEMIDESISGKADSDDVYTKNEVYTKAEVDEAIDDIDLSGYYTKSEVDASQLAQDNKINAISGNVQTLNGKVNTISGEVNTIKEEIDDIDLSNYYTKGESDGKYQLKGDYVTGAQMSAYTYDKQTIDDKIAQGGTFDPTQYYNKTATDALLDLKADTANTYTKSEVNGLVGNKADATALTQVNNVVTAHTANTTVHVTSAEKNAWNNKSDFSGNYNDLTNKPTIHTYTAGTGIDITNDVISATGGSQPVDAYTKAESDAKFATITNFNSHSGNTTMHVTSAEKATWNAKADASNVYTKTEVDNKVSVKPNVWCGNESEWSQISGSTESGTIYLVY